MYGIRKMAAIPENYTLEAFPGDGGDGTALR
jgi:hypothetical protein